MSWIVTVIWIWLRILTRIHKADPLLWFYEELKHCRKLKNTIWLTDLLRAWEENNTVKKKKKKNLIELLVFNRKIFFFISPLKQVKQIQRENAAATQI